MYRACLVVALGLLFSASSWAQQAADEKKTAEALAKSPAEKKLLANPNDIQAIMAYQSEVMTTVMRVMQSDPKTARQKLDDMETFMGELKVDDAAAKARLSSIKLTNKAYRDRIDVQNISLVELKKKLLENPNDSKAISAYVTKVQIEISPLARTQPDVAEAKLKAVKEVLAKASAAATTDAAKRQVTTASNGTLSLLERSIETGRLSLAELGKKLIESPDSTPALSDFYSKLSLEVSQKMRSQPDEAAKLVQEAKDVFQKLEAATTSASVKSLVGNYKRTIESMSRSIEAGKKLTEMIGKDAAPLKVEGWVNGSPLTDGDLKGKVVFLDFWAVWCGPCIATFPHLKEWNEKYADKGLVMIGLTNYYNYKWDEDAKKASRATEKITPAEEQEMLVKFAESHELKHRFAIEANRSLSEYYGVTGIPHVAIIDREGKIRMMKVGSGPANAKEIGDLLAELLDTKAAGGQ